MNHIEDRISLLIKNNFNKNISINENAKESIFGKSIDLTPPEFVFLLIQISNEFDISMSDLSEILNNEVTFISLVNHIKTILKNEYD